MNNTSCKNVILKKNDALTTKYGNPDIPGIDRIKNSGNVRYSLSVSTHINFGGFYPSGDTSLINKVFKLV